MTDIPLLVFGTISDKMALSRIEMDCRSIGGPNLVWDSFPGSELFFPPGDECVIINDGKGAITVYRRTADRTIPLSHLARLFRKILRIFKSDKS
jgi:hypothetical protein